MLRIAIDGPGGAGKSSLAKAVAKKLEIIYVDTGALYRTIGYYMVNHGIEPTDAEAVAKELGKFTLELTYENGEQVILLDGENVKDAIRTPQMSMAASNVSAIKEVRDFLLNTQRDIAKKHSVIMDGRDIGTVILPNAEVKIFLTASPEVRAQRRLDEMLAKGQQGNFQQVLADIKQRDYQDSHRPIAPLKQAKDAVLLDTSDLDIDGVIAAMKKIVGEKISL